MLSADLCSPVPYLTERVALSCPDQAAGGQMTKAAHLRVRGPPLGGRLCGPQQRLHGGPRKERRGPLREERGPGECGHGLARGATDPLWRVRCERGSQRGRQRWVMRLQASANALHERREEEEAALR